MFWLGGFTEGEGSLSISIEKNKKAPYGIFLQPEFNVVQHKNGLNILNGFKTIFKNKGHILSKSGSKNVLVNCLKGIKYLSEYIVPFYLKYLVDFSSKYYINEFNKYLFILNKLNERNLYG